MPLHRQEPGCAGLEFLPELSTVDVRNSVPQKIWKAARWNLRFDSIEFRLNELLDLKSIATFPKSTVIWTLTIVARWRTKFLRQRHARHAQSDRDRRGGGWVLQPRRGVPLFSRSYGQGTLDCALMDIETGHHRTGCIHFGPRDPLESVGTFGAFTGPLARSRLDSGW